MVNQWVIYDKYMAYEHAKELAEEHETKMDSGMAHLKSVRKRLTEPEQEDPKEVMLNKMMRCARILERMVNQNNHFDIAQGKILFLYKILFLHKRHSLIVLLSFDD